MLQRKHIQKRNQWICREFFRLRKKRLPVKEALSKIQKALRRKHVFLALRTIENIIYRE